MHTKTELEGMSMDELQALAQKANAEMSEDRSTLIYNIIDAESLMTANNAVPKKRGRKPKAEAEAAQPVETTEETTAQEQAPAEEEKPAPKKRGRKSKAEKEAEEKAAAEKLAEEAAAQEKETAPAVVEEAAPAEVVAEEAAPAPAQEETAKPATEAPQKETAPKAEEANGEQGFDVEAWLNDGDDLIIIQDIPDPMVQLGEINARTEDCLLGIRVVKSFAREDKEIEKYYKDEIIGDMKASHILIKAEYKDGDFIFFVAH